MKKVFETIYIYVIAFLISIMLSPILFYSWLYSIYERHYKYTIIKLLNFLKTEKELSISIGMWILAPFILILLCIISVPLWLFIWSYEIYQKKRRKIFIYIMVPLVGIAMFILTRIFWLYKIYEHHKMAKAARRESLE